MVPGRPFKTIGQGAADEPESARERGFSGLSFSGSVYSTPNSFKQTRQLEMVKGLLDPAKAAQVFVCFFFGWHLRISRLKVRISESKLMGSRASSLS